MLVHILKLNNLDCLDWRISYSNASTYAETAGIPNIILSNKICPCENTIINTWYTINIMDGMPLDNITTSVSVCST